MNEERYNRQTILKGFGPEGQQKLKSAKVLVVGAGGLGVPVLSYLWIMIPFHDPIYTARYFILKNWWDCQKL
jgi:hypothetical protein